MIGHAGDVEADRFLNIQSIHLFSVSEKSLRLEECWSAHSCARFVIRHAQSCGGGEAGRFSIIRSIHLVPVSDRVSDRVSEQSLKAEEC